MGLLLCRLDAPTFTPVRLSGAGHNFITYKERWVGARHQDSFIPSSVALAVLVEFA